VAKAIDFVKSLSEENAALRGKLDGYRRRIDELEVLVKAFKEDQGRIEAGIMSALERLNQFEDAVERGFSVPVKAGDEERPITAETSDPAIAVTTDEPAALDAASIDAASADTAGEDSDEAILAQLEAEEAAAKAAKAAAAGSGAAAESGTAFADPATIPSAEERKDQGGELDIF
jgi:hypothetical protein